MDFSDVDGRKVFKAFGSYFAFFGSRFVGNDIQLLCGNYFDHPIVKTFTLWCIMYNASDNVKIATAVTLVILLLQYILSNVDACKPYEDKLGSSQLDTRNYIWPRNIDPDASR